MISACYIFGYRDDVTRELLLHSHNGIIVQLAAADISFPLLVLTPARTLNDSRLSVLPRWLSIIICREDTQVGSVLPTVQLN